MSRLGTITRRTFLVGSSAIAGGVAFGGYMIARPHDNPLEDHVSSGEATFNPWVRVSNERITFITPHVDIGQGVAHSQALLIAEEMDVDPASVTLEYPQPDPAYYNRAIAMEAGEALSHITPLPEGLLQGAVGSVMKVLGQQVTGGSTTIPDGFVKLREAGAMARETLKKAASEETGVPVADLRTENGKVITPDGTGIAYTDLAERAAKLEPVRNVPLRSPSEWKLIGKPTQRRDILAKSTGTMTYGIDLEMDGMVHASARVNPRRSGIKSYDAAAAETMRGVKKIVPVTNGVAVVADNTWRAIQAVNAIDCDWEEAAYPAEQDAHWAEIEKSFGDETRLNAEWRNDGDVSAAEGEKVEAEYRAPYVAHQPLEPLNAIALVEEDRVQIWTGTQVSQQAKPLVAAITGHEVAQILIHNQSTGGSFGHRLEFEQIKLAAEIANQMRGTPVKLTFSREEDFVQDYPRHIAIARGRGTHSGGAVTSIDVDVAAAPVILSQTTRMGIPLAGPDSQLAAGIWNAPYDVANFRTRAYAVPGLAPVSSWRSVGASYGGFFIESLMDELIHAAGADPVEERLRLMSDPIARGVLEKAADAASWNGSNIGRGRGRGVALVSSFGVPVAEIIDVTMTDDGIRLDDVWVVADPGTVVDPVNIENHIQGAVIWALGHAINSEITYSDGMAEQTNFYDAEGMRLYQTPRIHVSVLENNPHIRGMGEPPVPPAPPALANSVFAATGTRLREMPFNKTIDFI